MSGKLYIVATPIGNMEDITLRALRTLEEVDAIAAEDTRVTGKLLSRHGISKPLISLNQHNELSRAQHLIWRMQVGENIAYCSDAGTPALSDPGAKLVALCREQGIECVPIPGPSALAAAISVAGLDAGFLFHGFLPSSGSQRNKALAGLEGLEWDIVLYEAPHRLGRTLADLRETLGDRRVTIARELTKIHEEVVTCGIDEAIQRFDSPKGEIVLIVHRSSEAKEIDMDGAAQRMAGLLADGIPRKEAARMVAGEFGVAKNVAYDMGMDDKWTEGDSSPANGQ